MCKLEAGLPGSTCSTRDIRLGAGRNTSHANTTPLPLLEGSQLKLVGLGLGGSVLSLPSLYPLLFTPAVPSFLSAIQTVHTAKQGAEGQGWGDCAFRKGKGVCKRGSEDVLLIEVAPGLFTGF